MVVLAVIGVLLALAFPYLNPKTTAQDVATRIGDLVREANREAMRLGPVRSDVVLGTGIKARTRLIAYGSTTNLTFQIDRLVEHAGDAGADWEPLKTYQMSSHVTAPYWADGVGSYTTLSATASSTYGSSTTPAFVSLCYVDGTCQGKTVFFQAVKQTAVNGQARVSIMPLGGAAYIRRDWN